MKRVTAKFPDYPVISGVELDETKLIYSTRTIDQYYQKGMTKFEERLAEYLGVKYAFATNSGYAAIVLALLAADVNAGDEVIVPAISWGQTLSPVAHIGAKPVFADIDRTDANTLQITFSHEPTNDIVVVIQEIIGDNIAAGSNITYPSS